MSCVPFGVLRRSEVADACCSGRFGARMSSDLKFRTKAHLEQNSGCWTLEEVAFPRTVDDLFF